MSLKTPLTQARFLPGTMVGDRWRIVSPLGQGGMGEVYRADDLKLGEVVALKFLPERLEHDASLRERFLSEARLARQVAHPNVCRMYDIGEIGGRPFLSMEFVDGEDLGSLLTRIGRLPHDKAVQIAREICAGLHAAHELGILHRDLKPSNVMIDGRGRARLTDFGLAALVEGATEQDPLAGTPLYMAPEQLGGQPPSVASDVYALGLVLYELFTGRKAFEAPSWAEQAYLKQNSTPSHPSQVAPGIDPASERAILRCLSVDPAQRPRSAALVAASLPGGDPLAAALAAGETPSPELVAEGAGEVSLSPRAAATWLIVFAAALVACIAWLPSRQLLTVLRLEKPPTVLQDRARELARTLGYSEIRDEYGRLYYYSSIAGPLLRRPGVREMSQVRDSAGHASPFGLRYFGSPGVLRPMDPRAWTLGPADRTLWPGEVELTIDGRGSLRHLEGMPPRLDSLAPPGPVDWDAVAALVTVGIPSRVIPDSSRLAPRAYADQRTARIAHFAGGPPDGMHMEMAAMRGRLVHLSIWMGSVANSPGLLGLTSAQRPAEASGSIIGLFGVLVSAGVLLLAWRHARSRQADLAAAARVATAAAAMNTLYNLLLSHRAEGWSTIPLYFALTVSNMVMAFFSLFVLYLAFEPIVRRTWPHPMIAWLRLTQGRWMDPRVGSDALRGVTSATVLWLLLYVLQFAWSRITGVLLMPGALENVGQQTDTLMGTAAALAQVLQSLSRALQIVLVFGAALAVTTLVARQRIVGVALSSVLTALLVVQSQGGPPSVFDIVATGLLTAAIVFCSLRWGLVSGLAFCFAMLVLRAFPMEQPGASWYWPICALGMGALAAAALWGYRAAMGKRAVFAFDAVAAPASATSPSRTSP